MIPGTRLAGGRRTQHAEKSKHSADRVNKIKHAFEKIMKLVKRGGIEASLEKVLWALCGPKAPIDDCSNL